MKEKIQTLSPRLFGDFFFGILDFVSVARSQTNFHEKKQSTWTSRERGRVVEFWWERTIIQTGEYWSNELTSPSDHPRIDMVRIPASFFDFDVWQEYFIHLNPIFNAHSYIFTFLDG